MKLRRRVGFAPGHDCQVEGLGCEPRSGWFQFPVIEHLAVIQVGTGH